MTPPPFIRNFSLGSSHPRIGETNIGPAAERMSTLLGASRDQAQAEDRLQAAAIDQFLVAPTLRYRAETARNFRETSIDRIEAALPIYLEQARGGDALGYFRTLQIQYGLLDRAEPAAIPALSHRTANLALEYATFLRGHPEIPDEERMRRLFNGARMLHLYLAYLLQPPRPLPDFPEREATLNLLFSALDSLDSELQSYHSALRERGFGGIEEYEGVAQWIALRRRLRNGPEGDRRQAALDLAEDLTLRPLPASNDGWQARAERALLEMPRPIEHLQAFDHPSPAEERGAALNALSLETLEVAAATLDRTNEESETSVMARYRDLGLVLSVSILRHPDQTLEELLNELQDAARQADFRQEVSRAQSSNPAIAAALGEALNGRDIAGLVQSARQAAQHVHRLREGLGAQILPAILEENRNHHPVRNVAEILGASPSVALGLQLPQGGSDAPIVLRQQAVELLRRGQRGLQEVDALQRGTHASLNILREALSNEGAIDGFTSRCLGRLSNVISHGRDHEIAALYSVFTALDRNIELAPGIRLSQASRNQARSLRERMDSAGFRAGRVLSHLGSSSSLMGVLIGVLATEFLPTLLIARAGISGGLSVGRVPLVSAGALTWQGSVITGLATGAGMSLVSSSLHQWERHRMGLGTHFGRDFGTSLIINSLTFGLTLPVSRLLNRALTPRFDATTPLTPLSAGRRFLLHGSNVALGGATSFGLGYLGRGVATGQWRTSPEEIAENLGSIFLWESGGAAVRGIRRLRGYSAELGPFRQAEVQRLTSRILELNPRLQEQGSSVHHHLAREEARYPGWIQRFGARIDGGGHVPILEGQGRHQRLILVPENALPPPPPTPPPAPESALAPAEAVSGRETLPPPEAEVTFETPIELSPLHNEPTLYYFRINPEAALPNAAFNGDGGGLLNLAAPPHGEVTWVIGRENFWFLSPETRRVIRRSHFQIRRDAEGNFWIRDLRDESRSLGPVHSHGTFYVQGRSLQPFSHEAEVPLNAQVQTIGIGNSSEPILMGLQSLSDAPSEGLPISRIDPSWVAHSISLAAGQRQRMNGLLIRRGDDNNQFRAEGGENLLLQIIRDPGDPASLPEVVNARENPTIGEIGGRTRLVVTDNEARQSQIYLLNFDGPAYSPQVEVDFHGSRSQFSFDASGEIAFGKTHQPHIFAVPWISRNHFRIRRTNAEAGQTPFQLIVDSRFGMMVDEYRLAQNETMPLDSGTWELGFFGPDGSVDRSFRLTLP